MMERLTERTVEGLPFYPRCFERCGGHPDGDVCLTCPLEEERLEKLTAYEDVCPDPALAAKQLEILKLYAECLKGIGLGRLGELAAAEREGRLVELPCKVGATVYTIQQKYFDCENCEHGKTAKYNAIINKRCCDMEKGQECPVYIQEHTVEAFDIGINKDNKVELSGPGAFGFEGVEVFSGVDGKCYLTREAAEMIVKEKEETPND